MILTLETPTTIFFCAAPASGSAFGTAGPVTAELGVTATVFPSDEAAKVFLKSQGRGDAWREILADENAEYDEYEEIKISKFTFSQIDKTYYYERAMGYQKQGSFVVGGANYEQGSSREHAVLGPRYLGVKAVIAKSFARIHLQNLSNFGILPLCFINPDDWEKIAQGDVLAIPDVRNAIRKGNRVKVINLTQNGAYETEHPMTPRQVEMVLAGNLINLVRQKLGRGRDQSHETATA